LRLHSDHLLAISFKAQSPHIDIISPLDIKAFPLRPTILIAAILFFFVPAGHNILHYRLAKELLNTGHIVFFALVALETFRYFDKAGKSRRFSSLICLCLIAGGAIGIELGQLLVSGREFQIRDLLYGLAGGIAALLFKGAPQQHIVAGFVMRAMSVLLIAGCLFPLSSIIADEIKMHRDFPLLSGFEGSTELTRWGGVDTMSRVSHPVAQGSYSARIALNTKQFSGIMLDYFPGNWQEAEELSFKIFNPGLPMNIHYRIHDAQHSGENQRFNNRYNNTTILQTGWNLVRTPLADIEQAPVDRQMDLGRIRGLGIFVSREPENRVIYLDDVRLIMD